MSVELIALDLDGTLLADDHRTVPDRCREAIRRAEERGVATAVASGRTTGLLRPVLRQTPQLRCAVISNGAAAVDLRTGERLFERPMAPRKARDILERLAAFPHLVVEVYAQGESWLAEKDRPDFERRGQENIFWKEFIPYTHFVPDLAAAMEGRSVEKITVSRMRPGEREALLAALNAGEELAVSSSIADYMELNERGVDKASGLARLCGALGIPRERVMALGDGDNDFELMEWAGVSVAMKNGLPETKARARYETALTNDEGGVGEAIERFVLDPSLLPPDDTALALAMTEYEAGCAQRVGHFMRVAAYAALIARAEGFPERTCRLAYIAGLVHDIGIRPALERYGSAAGPYQEREGEAPARRLLSRLGYGLEAIERAAFLVAHHHTCSAVDGDDFQALVEADFLVNMDENHMTRAQAGAARRAFFRTGTGLRQLALFAPEETKA